MSISDSYILVDQGTPFANKIIQALQRNLEKAVEGLSKYITPQIVTLGIEGEAPNINEFRETCQRWPHERIERVRQGVAPNFPSHCFVRNDGRDAPLLYLFVDYQVIQNAEQRRRLARILESIQTQFVGCVVIALSSAQINVEINSPSLIQNAANDFQALTSNGFWIRVVAGSFCTRFGGTVVSEDGLIEQLTLATSHDLVYQNENGDVMRRRPVNNFSFETFAARLISVDQEKLIDVLTPYYAASLINAMRAQGLHAADTELNETSEVVLTEITVDENGRQLPINPMINAAGGSELSVKITNEEEYKEPRFRESDVKKYLQDVESKYQGKVNEYSGIIAKRMGERQRRELVLIQNRVIEAAIQRRSVKDLRKDCDDLLQGAKERYDWHADVKAKQQSSKPTYPCLEAVKAIPRFWPRPALAVSLVFLIGAFFTYLFLHSIFVRPEFKPAEGLWSIPEQIRTVLSQPKILPSPDAAYKTSFPAISSSDYFIWALVSFTLAALIFGVWKFVQINRQRQAEASVRKDFEAVKKRYDDQMTLEFEKHGQAVWQRIANALDNGKNANAANSSDEDDKAINYRKLAVCVNQTITRKGVVNAENQGQELELVPNDRMQELFDYLQEEYALTSPAVCQQFKEKLDAKTGTFFLDKQQTSAIIEQAIDDFCRNRLNEIIPQLDIELLTCTDFNDRQTARLAELVTPQFADIYARGAIIRNIADPNWAPNLVQQVLTRSYIFTPNNTALNVYGYVSVQTQLQGVCFAVKYWELLGNYLNAPVFQRLAQVCVDDLTDPSEDQNDVEQSEAEQEADDTSESEGPNDDSEQSEEEQEADDTSESEGPNDDSEQSEEEQEADDTAESEGPNDDSEQSEAEQEADDSAESEGPNDDSEQSEEEQEADDTSESEGPNDDSEQSEAEQEADDTSESEGPNDDSEQSEAEQEADDTSESEEQNDVEQPDVNRKINLEK